MKRIIVCLAFLCPSLLYLHSSAQTVATPVKPDTLWRRGGFAAINFNQASFTNWAAGGENSLGLNTLFSGFIKYKSKDSTIQWDNTLDLAYGILKTGGQLRKTDDKIDAVSKIGKKAFDHVFYTGLAEFKSQFANGYNYPNDTTIVSKFASPAYVLLSLGMDWKPKSYFDVYVSPATGRLTIVADQILADSGAYGVDPAIYSVDTLGNRTLVSHGKRVRFEFGAFVSITFQKDILKNVNFKSKLDLFNNYTDKNESNRGNIDVAWENDLVMKVNKYISASIITNLIYDNDIPYVGLDGVKHGPRIQFKELLGVGFSMKF